MNKKINLRDAISIGIGGMVGGGIFAVLGLAVSMSRGGTPVAFLIAGIIALFTAYSYARLSVKFPDQGGTVRFINEKFGKSVFSGGVNNLLWVCYIIMLSLYATAFASYAPNLFSITDNPEWSFHIYASAIVLLATGINYYNVEIVGRIETYSVAIKLFILISFTILGIIGLFGNPHLEQLSVENWTGPIQLIAGGMVIFVAYEGFELIANAAPDLKEPEKNIPRAYFISVIFVIILYVIIAVVTVGSLSFDEIDKAKDYVLAEAAKPMLGKMGFAIITVAALISTFSAINASLYGGSRVSYEIADDGELPHALTDTWWNQPIGLIITSVCTLVMANFVELKSISTAGSIGFLIIFSVVNYIAFSLGEGIGANKLITGVGFVMCLISVVVLIATESIQDYMGVIISVAIIIACFIMEFIYKRSHKRPKRCSGKAL